MSEHKLIPEVFVVQGSSADPEAKDGCDTEKQGGPNTKPLQESDGFIAITELTLDKLPEPIRSTDNLDTILDVAKHVVAINNNGTSSERPPDFQLGETLQGTGFIFFIAEEQAKAAEGKKKQHIAVVSTNKHVLYNDEEIKKATIDIFYDEPMAAAYKSGQMKRTARGRGVGTLRSNQEDDFTLAVFFFNDAVMAHIAHPTFAKMMFPVLLHQLQTPTKVEGTSQESVVCVISHPLGQPKKVSFRQLLEQDVAKRSLRHNAATRVGSSGAPLLIFSPTPQTVPANSIWYHTSFDKTTQIKVGGLQVNDSRLFEINLSLLDEATERYSPSDLALFMRIPTVILEKLISSAYESVRHDAFLKATASNVSFLSCLGSLVLQPDAFLPSLSLDDLHACQPLEESEVRAVVEQGGEDIRDAVKVLCTASPGLLPSDLEQSLDPGLLSQFLLDQGPCYCRDIFAALESGLDHKTGKKDSLCFLHPLSTPVNASQQPSWPFVSGNERLNRMVPDGCCAQILMKRLAESPFRDLKYTSLPTLLVLMEASKTVREWADPKRCSSSEPSEKAQALGNGELSNKQQAVFKLLAYFVPWGLKFTNAMYGIILMQCAIEARKFPLTLTPPWTIDAEVDGEPENPTQPSQRRFVTFEDLQAMNNTDHLLKHITAHFSQPQHDAPKAAAVPCSCKRPLLADEVDAADHIQTLLLSRSDKEKQAKADATREDSSSTVAKDESTVSLPQTKIPDSEQGTTGIEEKLKMKKCQDHFKKASSLAVRTAQTHPAGVRQFSARHGNELLSFSREESKSDEDDHPSCRSEEDSNLKDTTTQGIRKEKSTGLKDTVAGVSVARQAEQKFPEEDASKDAKQQSDSDTPQDHNCKVRGESNDSESPRQEPTNCGKVNEENTLESESPDGSTHDKASQSLFTCATNVACGSGHRVNTCIPSVDPPRMSKLSFDEDSEPRQISAASIDRRHLGADDGGAESDRNQTFHAEGIDNVVGDKMRGIKDRNQFISERTHTLSAALRTTIYVRSKNITPVSFNAELPSLKEVRQAKQLVEQFRVALLELPVSHCDALSAVEVLYYNCPRFLALCHRLLGCSCDSYATKFPLNLACETTGEIVYSRTNNQQSKAGTSTRGTEKDHNDVLGFWQQKATQLAAGGSGPNKLWSQILRAEGLPAATSSSSDEKVCSEQSSAPNDNETPREKEQTEKKTERVGLSVEALKAHLMEAIEKNPEDDNLRFLMDEGFLQAHLDMFIFAESERISLAQVHASYDAALLVLAHDCRKAIRPPEGLDALVMKSAERFFELLRQQRTKASKQ